MVKQNLRESLKSFLEKVKEHNVQFVLTNHTAIDCGLERIAYAKKRMSYMPNIYVMTEQEVEDFFKVFENLCIEKLK